MTGKNIADNVTTRNDEQYAGQEAEQAESEFEKAAEGQAVKGKNSPILIVGGAVVLATLALVALITEYA